MNSLTAIRSYREVGEMLGIPHQEVYYLEKSALKKLAKKLSDFKPETAPQPKSSRASLSPERRVAANDLRWKPDGGQS